jgi:peptide/nickel transport system substrate-binding protein
MAIISEAVFGQGAPMATNVNPAIEWAYNDQLELIPFDPGQAASLLDEAGWTDENGDGVRECHGCLYATENAPMRLSLIYQADNETRENTVLILQDQLSRVGFQIDLEPVERSTWFDRLLGQTFDMSIAALLHPVSEPYDEGLWSSLHDRPGADLNFSSYYRPEVDQLLAEARSLPGCAVDDRAPLYRRIQQLIYEDQPCTFLYTPYEILVYSERVGGMEPGPWGFRYNIQNWFIQP